MPHRAEQRYLPGTKVLETTFTTAGGAVRVSDALTLPGSGLGPLRELARNIEGLAGAVPMGWSVEPRFGYGEGRTSVAWVSGVPVAAAGNQALAVCSWDAGPPARRRRRLDLRAFRGGPRPGADRPGRRRRRPPRR